MGINETFYLFVVYYILRKLVALQDSMKYEWGYFEGIYNTHIYFMELIKHLLMGIAIQQSNVARGKSSMNGGF
jgi:uncharacterized membrane protein YozB (DUF420 family)